MAPDDAYRVDAWVHEYGRGSKTLTRTALDASLSATPPVVTRLFGAYEPGRFPGMEAEIDRVIDEHLPQGQRDDPYAVAKTVQEFLRGQLRGERPFRYDADIGDLFEDGPCDPARVPECLVQARRGFCQQYATTMVMMLRHRGIPARYVQGFLPGEREGGASHVVRAAAAHAWVEAWFDAVGWIRFDPTPLQETYGQEPTDLPRGQAPGDAQEGSEPPDEPTPAPASPEPSPTADPLEGGGGMPTGSGDPLDVLRLLAIGLVAAMIVVVGMVVIAVYRLRHLPGPDPDLAYRGVVSLASRVGHGPRPSQTELEYMGSLSETLPAVRGDLELVAQVRVESVYGRRSADARRSAALRAAYARARTALLRLFLRR